MTKINKLHKKWVKNPEYQRAYDELKTEFELARFRIQALRGNSKRGLELLDKIDRHFDRK
jgi:hypothetical protein